MPVHFSIKNVPDELAERIRQRARRHRRSLQKELLAILEEAVSPRRVSLEEAYRRVQELRLRTGPESASFVREDRDAR